jgi:hypothetical protein
METGMPPDSSHFEGAVEGLTFNLQTVMPADVCQMDSRASTLAALQA